MRNTRIFRDVSEVKGLSDTEIARLTWLGECSKSDFGMLMSEADERKLKLADLWKRYEK